MSPIILYHANCADGFCSAWVARKIHSTGVFIPVQYGQDPPDVTGRMVFILDFSYKRPVLFDMCKVAMSVVVIDHHKTAKAELDGFDKMCNELFGRRRCMTVFDMTRSASRLSWNFFFGTASVPPWLVDYTQDRDMWWHGLYKTHEINAALHSYPFDFDVWDKLSKIEKPQEQFAEQGAAILRYQKKIVDLAVQNASEVDIDGHKILSVNSTVLFSEIAGTLAIDRPFGAAWFIRQDGKKQWSLRSTDKGVDVSEIAKKFGGGGHRNAAGFEETI